MTFRPSAPHRKRRWLASLTIVVLAVGAVGVSTAIAAPVFNFVQDEDGQNDEPGQKDLTADSTAIDSSTGHYWTAWQWDDTAWNGTNTGDACSLFNTDGGSNFLADAAVCVTIGKPAAEKSTRVYLCTDNRADRCTGATLVGTEGVTSANDWCSVAPAAGAFSPFTANSDTQARCDITVVDADVSDVAGLDNGTFLNSCSYPSQEPNSDPSDCVHRIAITNATVATAPTATTTWTATLNDRVQLTPNTATGSVVFKLWNTSACTGTAVWVSNSVALASGYATSVGAGTASGNNVIDQTTTDSDLKFYWTVEYTPSGPFAGPATPACGEETTITPASVSPNVTTFP